MQAPYQRSAFLILQAALLIAIWFITPHDLPTLLYKILNVTIGATLGYIIDLIFFPNYRIGPKDDRFDSQIRSAMLLRRGFVIGICVLAFGNAL